MIIANMATFPPRHENWRRVLECIAPQVDRVNIVFNEMDDVPEVVGEFDNVHGIIPDADLKDTGKFLPEVGANDWAFTFDDDILYPSDYVSKCIQMLEATGIENAVGGFHGSIYEKPRFLRSRLLRKLLNKDPNYIVGRRKIFGFSFALEQSLFVDQLGTGAAFMKGRHVPPFSAMQTAQKFVDVAAAHYWFVKGIQPICFAREKDWIRPMHDEKSIGSINLNFTMKNPGNVADIIHEFAYKRPQIGQQV